MCMNDWADAYVFWGVGVEEGRLGWGIACRTLYPIASEEMAFLPQRKQNIALLPTSLQPFCKVG